MGETPYRPRPKEWPAAYRGSFCAPVRVKHRCTWSRVRVAGRPADITPPHVAESRSAKPELAPPPPPEPRFVWD